MIDGYWIHTLNRAIMPADIITRHLKRLIISYKGKLIPALILSTHSNDAFQDSYSHYTQHCSWVRRAKQFGLLGTVHEGGPLFRGAHLTLPRREWANCCALFLAPAVHQKLSNKKKIYPFFTPINKYINTPRVRVITSGRMGLTNTKLTFRKLGLTHRFAIGIKYQRPDR